ncbi:lysozyme inhibitor LprI family protein [Frateuria defendens]|uniref:lysozyme inhibitor LprI family protein n=1 Tax=Frateuria defendens TaxID=2219559 RepID=UPI00301743DC
MSPGFAHGQQHGDDHGIRPSYKHCLDAAGGTTPSMQACMDSEYDFQDARLNKAYKQVLEKLDQAGRSKLRAEERAWIGHREAHCKADPDGGQAAELLSYDCSVHETAKQAAHLENLLRGEGVKR